MPVGFEAHTGAGTIQVLAGHSNFHLRHKWDILEAGSPVHTVSGQVITRAVSRDFQANTPIVAVTGPRSNFGLSVIVTNLGGGNWRVTAYTGDANVVMGSIWVYDSVVTGNPANFGIEVYHEDGSLSFASWAKPLRVVGTQSVPYPSTPGAYVDVPAGRRYAVVASRSCQTIQRNVGFRLAGPSGDGTGSQSNGRFYFAGNNALIPWGDNAIQFTASGHFFFVDVTGH